MIVCVLLEMNVMCVNECLDRSDAEQSPKIERERETYKEVPTYIGSNSVELVDSPL